MKKILSIVLSLCMLLSTTAGLNLTSFAETSGDYKYKILSEGTAEIIGYYGSDTDLTIPSTLDGYTVTSIGVGTFERCSSITSIKIPDGVTSIGAWAFEYCSSLTNIVLPDSITRIGSLAFKYTAYYYDKSNWQDNILYVSNYLIDSIKDNNESYTINDNTKLIADYAFAYCKGLSNIAIPDSVISIGQQAFYSCECLTSIEIGKNVTNIGSIALAECTNLKNIIVNSENKNYSSLNGALFNKDKTELIQYPIGNEAKDYVIPNSVTNIKNSAFGYCTSLMNLTISDNVTSIENNAFIGCKNLTNVITGKSIINIGDSAFYDCESLTSIIISNNVSTIGERAFESCKNLKSIIIPDSVTSIGEEAFSYCDKLVNVKLGNGIKGIVESTFYKCTNLETVTFSNNSNITCIGYMSFAYCEKLKNITIPYGVKTFGASAFYNCKSLEKIELPDSVTELNNAGVFKDSGLKEIKMSKNITGIGYGFIENTPLYNNKSNWSNGVLYLDNYLIKAEKNLKNGECIIRENTKVIAGSAFVESNIKDIVIPESVIDIGTYAFSSCNELNSITIMNPSCNIYNQAYGISSVIPAKVIIGYTGSTAEDYAIKANIPFTSIDNHNHTYKNVITKATMSKNGKIVPTCSVCGYTKSSTTIYYPKTISLSATSYTYDGKAKKPSVIVTDSSGKKIAANNFTVTYSNNKNVGKATVKITFKGNYIGTKSLTFKINPKATSISSVTAQSKAFTIKWKKQATQTTGYEIQYSTDKNFKKGNKTVAVTKNSTTSKKIAKLTGKKKYYVRIRTYKSVSGTKYYSTWSKAKTVTTKK